jgi:succinyl-CoA synthetase alpha subunit
VAGEYAKAHVTKPIYAYVAGHHAPVGVQMGHAGAILGNNKDEAANAKTARLQMCGVTVANDLPSLIAKIKV